ncbi:MAG: ribonuclease HII [Candidatus Omnitrophica bacterium]|nr:ribonuclease HII [Candidatus Omnitrophota bacterium]
MKRRSRTYTANSRLLKQEKLLSNSGYTIIAGVDEAGRGPLAGPVVAGAVILKSFDFPCEINDSKKLSKKKREKAYKEIFKRAIVGVGVIGEKTIDEINIYQATLRAMEMAVANLQILPDYIIVDGRMKLVTRCPVKCIIGGDSKSLSIAAASIIAKVTRDEIMSKYDKEYPQYGFARHNGYGTRLHKANLKKFGPSPIHRYSYRPVKEALV